MIDTRLADMQTGPPCSHSRHRLQGGPRSNRSSSSPFHVGALMDKAAFERGVARKGERGVDMGFVI